MNAFPYPATCPVMKLGILEMHTSMLPNPWCHVLFMVVQARRQLGTRHEAEEHRFKEWAVSETMRMAEAVPEHVLNTRPDLLVGAVAAVNVKYVLAII